MIYIPLYQYSFLYPCRWYSAILDRSRGDWHGLWDPVWENEGPGARGPGADHPTCLQCPAQRDADQDFWTHTPWVKKSNLLVISDPLPPSSSQKLVTAFLLHSGKEYRLKNERATPSLRKIIIYCDSLPLDLEMERNCFNWPPSTKKKNRERERIIVCCDWLLLDSER